VSARKRKKRGNGFGRMLEVLAGVALILVVLVFGISIAMRYTGGEKETRSADPVSYVTPVPGAEDLEALRNRPTLKLLNGCGRAGLADRMQSPLRGAGFDVLDTDNADRFDYDRTVVRDRSGKAGAAEKLRDWLRSEYGVGEIREDGAAVPEADLILVIGRDLADSLAKRENRVR
jgi:hypothetical protein